LRKAAAIGTPIVLPQAVRNQGIYVTAFAPPGSGGNDTAASYGLLELSRPELLAQLRPGNSVQEHRELLLAAVRLAAEEPAPGRGESILLRAIGLDAGPAWRLIVDREAALGRCGRSLRRLYVPTRGQEWHRADAVARTDGGPWPQLDEAALDQLLKAVERTGDTEPTVDNTCLLLGIGVVPIGDDGTIEDWPLPAPSVELGRGLLEAWGRDLHPLFRHEQTERGAKARQQLRDATWLSTELFDEAALDGRIEPGVGSDPPYAPIDLWRQGAQRGFRTKLLPRLIVNHDDVPPAWASDIGIENPRTANCPERISRALERLRGDPTSTENERDLMELYRNLVAGALRANMENVPLLYRQVEQDGRISRITWGGRDDRIWHDPGEAASSALSAFRDVRIWVYRGASREQAESLGLTHFVNAQADIRSEGNQQPELADNLKESVWRALPDLLSAAALARDSFDHGEAINRQATLTIEHYERVWIEWDFEGKRASRGEEEPGDVFLRPGEEGRQAVLCFDGDRLPLVECAFPLSELLCGSRAFGSLFRDGLYAWQQGDRRQAAPEPPSVRRFRRDHNLTEHDVRHWRDQLQSARLTPDLREKWQPRVREVLENYGTLVEGRPEPGDTITPYTWNKVTKDVAETELYGLLVEALADAQPLEDLVPPVDFINYHRQRFIDHLKKSGVRYIAAAAEQHGSNQWSEALLEKLVAKCYEPISGEERQQLSHLKFDPDRVLRGRFELQEKADLSPSEAAQKFARGQISLDRLPDQAATVALNAVVPRTLAALAPAADADEWLRRSRRKAEGGQRAEKAVLSLAVARAKDWQETDQVTFKKAVDEIAAEFGDLAKDRSGDLTGDDVIARFLHVAEYIGSAGFDVLVPDPKHSRFLRVEVKRVNSVVGPVRFFLSDNERGQALRLRNETHPWRLWLVAGNNAIADATQLLDTFDRGQVHLDALLEVGLQPGEWVLIADLTGP